MKTKMMLIVTLAMVLGGGVMLFAPRYLSAQTNSINSSSSKILYYTCPMHPSVKSDKPGNCPECNMELLPVYEESKDTNAPPATAKTNAPMMMPGGCCAVGLPR